MVRIFEQLLGGGNPSMPEETQAPKREEKRCNGKIIKVSKQGWGFISSKDIEFTRIFFHWTALKQDTLRFPELKIGMKVEFTPLDDAEKGVKAIKITVHEK